MDSRREPPALRRLLVAVVVISVVADLAGIAIEPNHQHVNRAGGAVSSRRDDVVDVDVLHALLDPPDVLAAARAAPGRFGQPLPALEARADHTVLERRKE